MIENNEVEVYFNFYLLLINYWNAAAFLFIVIDHVHSFRETIFHV